MPKAKANTTPIPLTNPIELPNRLSTTGYQTILNTLTTNFTYANTDQALPDKYQHIQWLTDGYEPLGNGFQVDDPIIVDTLLNAPNGNPIVPRAMKSQADKKDRTKKKAEVFTPSWVIDKQVTAVDENYQADDLTTYLNRTWLEITCGEAPYITTRYEMATLQPIAISDRVGFLDRKFARIKQLHTDSALTPEQFMDYAFMAYHATYGFEWNGDSLLIARQNLLDTFIDNYLDLFGAMPTMVNIQAIAHVIITNIIQMDGLKGTIPMTDIPALTYNYQASKVERMIAEEDLPEVKPKKKAKKARVSK